jgi:hypothetical protein
MKFRSISLLIALLLLPPVNAQASAGFYPTKVGDVIDIQGCVLAKAKYPLRIYLGDSNGKSILIKQINSLPKKQGECAKGEIEFLSPWRVDRRGDYSLYLRDMKNKRNYPVWPDGIESR